MSNTLAVDDMVLSRAKGIRLTWDRSFPCHYKRLDLSVAQWVLKLDLRISSLKLNLYDKKQSTNKQKIRILSQTSIPFLIRHASVILIVGLHL